MGDADGLLPTRPAAELLRRTRPCGSLIGEVGEVGEDGRPPDTWLTSWGGQRASGASSSYGARPDVRRANSAAVATPVTSSAANTLRAT